jgi:biopolymer transport protein ExbD
MGLHRSKGFDSKVQVPITPMLDFTFQLLFFFLLWFRISGFEGQMDLSLPSDKPTVDQENKGGPIDKAIDKDPDELKDPPEVTVLIKAIQGDKEETLGQISEITVRLKEGDTVIPIPDEGSNRAELWLARLQEHLKKVRETLNNKDDVVMKGERRLRWQYIVRVRDACQKAGFTNAHFSPPPDA